MATAIMKQKGIPEMDDVEEIISKISEESPYKRHSFSTDKKSSDFSGGFDEQTEIREKMGEESRILYVALTRAIRNVVWLHDLDKDIINSWGNYLEVSDSWQ